jgi:hypothetical protein
MLWSVTIISFVGSVMALSSFLVPFFQVFRLKRFRLDDLFVTFTPFSRITYMVTACLSAMSVVYMIIYAGILMREDIFVFGQSSHDATIEVTLAVFYALFFIAATTFFPSFYTGNKAATITSGAVCAACSFVFLLLACGSRENVVAFAELSAAGGGASFTATLTPEDEQIMLAFYQMCCFILFGHLLLMHALLWNIVYNRLPAKNLLLLPRAGSAK